MKPRSPRAFWLVAGALASIACASSPEPQFYTLFPRDGSTLASEPLEVQLQRPGLPGYLDRPQIVRHEKPGRLEFSGAARWGAPLEKMVGDILAQNLAQRLPKASVYGESGAISSSPDVLVEVDIQRFELTDHGAVELVAQVAVRWPKTSSAARPERYALSRSPDGRGTSQLVNAMSALLAELSNAIAHSLRAGAPSAPLGEDAAVREQRSERRE